MDTLLYNGSAGNVLSETERCFLNKDDISAGTVSGGSRLSSCAGSPAQIALRFFCIGGKKHEEAD